MCFHYKEEAKEKEPKGIPKTLMSFKQVQQHARGEKLKRIMLHINEVRILAPMNPIGQNDQWHDEQKR
jgi:hypothetical protein